MADGETQQILAVLNQISLYSQCRYPTESCSWFILSLFQASLPICLVNIDLKKSFYFREKSTSSVISFLSVFPHRACSLSHQPLTPSTLHLYNHILFIFTSHVIFLSFSISDFLIISVFLFSFAFYILSFKTNTSDLP